MSRCNPLCFFLPLLFVVSSGLADSTPAPTFPPRPRVLYSAAQMKALKSDPARAGERTNILQRANRIKAAGLTVPDKEGNWIFYYACPADGAGLKAESEYRHVCPVCKTVYTDERTAAAYRTQLYNRLEDDLRALALAYAVTSDTAYAQPVREALLKLARAWPTFTRHDRWGRTGLLAVVGGRRYCQLLDEAVSLIALSGVWDLVADAPCLSVDDRALIEKQLFRMPAAELGRYETFVGSRNNHQTWFNAAYAVTGLALGDEALLRRGLYGDVGLLWQLEGSIVDGIWYEGTMAYHFYALQAVMKTLEAAGTAGLDFSGNERLKSLWVGPLQLTYPSGQAPVFHDSDPVTMAHYRPFFEWGARYFKNPRLATASSAELGSTNLAGIGMAVLRRGKGTNAACAFLDYGLHGDSHGHPDKLNMVLYALERELVLDPGRISYSVPEFKTWCRTTVAHNTVVLGGRDQEPDEGRLLFFGETPDAVGALALSKGAYPGSVLSRFLVLADTLLVDVFTVDNADDVTDWVVHGRGDLSCSQELTVRTSPLAGKNGYQHLAQLKEAPCTNAPSRFTFSLTNGLFWRVWGVNDDSHTRLVTGTGIGYTLKDVVPFVLRRREKSDSTAYVSVFDFSGTGTVAATTPLPVLDAGGKRVADAVAMTLTFEKGSLLVALDLSPADRKLSVNGRVFNRWLIAKSKDCEPL